MGNDITSIKNKNALKSILGRLIFPKGGKKYGKFRTTNNF